MPGEFWDFSYITNVDDNLYNVLHNLFKIISIK